jgi:predicted anti-sigma-YlaC factor YlaD
MTDRCDAARAAMLELDLRDLEPGAPSEVARHLDACLSCRQAADRILSATRALAAARAVPPRLGATVAAERARLAARRRRRQRVRWTWIPALAAAGLGAVLLARPEADLDGTPLVARPAAAPPLVESAAAHVAVFTTDNPTITVVWQF